MLTYASELQLKPDCTQKMLLDVMNDWFIASSLGKQWMEENHCSPFDAYFQEHGEEFHASNAMHDQIIEILTMKDLLLIQLKSESESFKRNTYVVYRMEDVPVLFVGEQLDLKKVNTTLSEEDTGIYAKGIIQYIYWNELGSIQDGTVANSDRAVFLHASDLNEYKTLLSGEDKDFRTPVLYFPYSISKDVREFEIPFIGRLHLLAESTPIVAKKLEDMLGSDRYSSSLMMILPGGEARSVMDASDDFDFQAAIEKTKDALHLFLAEHPIANEFSLTSIQTEHMMQKLGEDAELKQTFDSIIADKEIEIATLSQELAEVRSQLRDEQSKSRSLQSGFEKVNDNVNSGVFETTEKPKYEHEFEDIILRVLEKERDGMTGDNTLCASRKYHVLCDILAHNFPSGTDTGLSDIIKGVFEEGKLTRDGIGRLQSAGFTVIKNDKKAHYRILWQDDERYAATYSATGSDFRGGKNCASDFTNTCFGY